MEASVHGARDLKGHAYGVAVDWWALGILVGELATGSTPFHAETPRQLMASILGRPTFPRASMAVTRLYWRRSLIPTFGGRRAGGARVCSTDWHAVEQLCLPLPEATRRRLLQPSAGHGGVAYDLRNSLEATTVDRRRVQLRVGALDAPPPPAASDRRARASRSPRRWWWCG